MVWCFQFEYCQLLHHLFFFNYIPYYVAGSFTLVGARRCPPYLFPVDHTANFKLTALAYHPDRNPGRESEVTAKFQRIQSAHEVLVDATERAKYDANRVRPSAGTYRNSYAGASGMRGNPWSNVSSQYPTPPKPPTSARKSQPPPPSSGAERYRKNFQTPQASAYQAAQEGPQARKNMYEGWENLRHPKTEHGPGKTWKTPQPPPRGTPTSGREESNARSQRPVPPRPAPAEGSSQRSHSSSGANRKGFMPNTPGGDEPPAPRGNYFTNRDKPSVAPDLPAREPSSSARYPAQDPSQNPFPDPLRPFRAKAMPSMEPRPSMETRPPMEPRLSTPYATHGGEKLNPFESANIHRSKSTRERTDTSSAQFNGSSSRESDPSYKSPHRARSFAEASTPRTSKPYATSVDLDSSSDDDYHPSRPSGYKQHPTIPQQPRETAPQPTPNANAPNPTSKPSNISIMRQWMKENPGVEPPINGFPPEGPPLRSGQAKTDANGNPSMYDTYSFTSKDNCFIPEEKNPFESTLPTVAEKISSKPSLASQIRSASMNLPAFFTKPQPTKPPSGVTTDSKDLNAFETLQRNVVDGLLSGKSAQSPQSYCPTGLSAKCNNQDQPINSNIPRPLFSNGRSPHMYNTYHGPANAENPFKTKNSRFAPYQYNDPAETGSPSKKLRQLKDERESAAAYPASNHVMSQLNKFREAHANLQRRSRFNFDFPNDTFATTRLPKKTFSSSAENISTTFTPEDWEGKFEAGGDYFKPDPKAGGSVPSPARGRAQSGSRSRGRSPVKARPVPGEVPSFAPPTEPTPTEPPGAKFSAEEWNQTFKPGTFAPPPPRGPIPAPLRKKTPTLRTTLGGKAAVVDDSSSNEDKPLFTGRKPTASPTSIDPDPMDVDTPPANHTVPQFTAAKISEKLSEPLKRPAASESASPTDTAEVNVGLNDLKIKDLITTLNFPPAPQPPATPTPSELASPSQLAYDKYLERYAKYTSEWDQYGAKFLLHLLARKNQTAEVGTKRWTDEVTTEQYRLGLKEDQAVLQKWQETMAEHERVVREFCIVRERMKGCVGVDASGASVGKRASPRKKTH
jgi:curved DNA-binding protein CbpA